MQTIQHPDSEVSAVAGRLAHDVIGYGCLVHGHDIAVLCEQRLEEKFADLVQLLAAAPCPTCLGQCDPDGKVVNAKFDIIPCDCGGGRTALAWARKQGRLP